MFNKSTFAAFALAALLGATGASAKDKLVGGEITNLNLDNGVGTLTIREKTTNQLRSFDVTEDTKVTFKRNAVGSNIPRMVDAAPRDLTVGDNVKLDVKTEVDGRVVVVGYEVLPVVVPAARVAAEPEPAPEPVYEAPVTDTYVAQNNTDYEYTNLPATASALPALAAFGFGSLALAGILTMRRTRSSK